MLTHWPQSHQRWPTSAVLGRNIATVAGFCHDVSLEGHRKRAGGRLAEFGLMLDEPFDEASGHNGATAEVANSSLRLNIQSYMRTRTVWQ